MDEKRGNKMLANMSHEYTNKYLLQILTKILKKILLKLLALVDAHLRLRTIGVSSSSRNPEKQERKKLEIIIKQNIKDDIRLPINKK